MSDKMQAERQANNNSIQSKGGNGGERTHSPFSPTQHSHMDKLLNTKGPIKATTQMVDHQGAIQSMYNQQNHMYNQQRVMANQRSNNHPYEYYDVEDDEQEAGQNSDVNMAQLDELSEASQQRTTNNRQLSAEEEYMILQELYDSAQENREFKKVLHILQNDGELRPLIFEHEALLRTLKDMHELKAEQMLSILTAAETEMYESSKKNEELIQQQRQSRSNVPTEDKAVLANLGGDTSDQSDKVRALKEKMQKLQREFDQLKQQNTQLKTDNESIIS
jgi:hypothetical protein